jgi:hypothetical protein
MLVDVTMPFGVLYAFRFNATIRYGSRWAAVRFIPHAATTDRRSASRYRIEADLSYQVFSRSKLIGAGYGRTLDISSGGVLFQSVDPVPPRRKIELAVVWPVRPEDARSVELWATGITLPPRRGRTVVKLSRFAFRMANPGKSSVAALRNDAMAVHNQIQALHDKLDSVLDVASTERSGERRTQSRQ